MIFVHNRSLFYCLGVVIGQYYYEGNTNEICVAKKTCLRYFHEINQHLKYPLLLARQGFLFFMLNQCLCLDWRWNKRGHVFDRVTLPKSLPLRSPPSVRPVTSVTFNHALGWTFSFATITADHMRFSGDPRVTGDSGKRPLYSLTHTRMRTHVHTHRRTHAHTHTHIHRHTHYQHRSHVTWHLRQSSAKALSTYEWIFILREANRFQRG